MNEEIGIDLGTATVIIYMKNKGIVLREPSIVAIDKNTNEIIAYGNIAKKMEGRTPKDIETIRPLKDGVISNFTLTSKMLKYFIKKVTINRFSFPKIMVCVPSQITEVERRAVIDSCVEAGAKKVYLIEEPVAAAIGAGIEIQKPVGNLIVDIGGGTTDIAVISIGGSVVSSSINIAGNRFDDLIIKFMKQKHNLLIGKNTAENLKIEIGNVYPFEKEKKTKVKGKSLKTGLPTTIEITSGELTKVLADECLKVSDEIKSVIEKAPPELAEDIAKKGIYMTGGGSLLYGIDKLISKNIGLKVRVAEDSMSCVAIGTEKALEDMDKINNKK